jgi:hypothetical protein
LGRKARPVFDRQRPTAKARIAGDRIVLVDAAEYGVFHLTGTELLRCTDKFLSAHALAQSVVADEHCPGDVPDARGVVPGQCGACAANSSATIEIIQLPARPSGGGDFLEFQNWFLLLALADEVIE